MTRKKKQHHTPELHLKQFTGSEPAGMVWTYDTQTGLVRPSIPKETGAETNFYALRKDNGEYVDAIEDWLWGVEDKTAGPYERLLAGEIPTGQERAGFTTFIASQFARSPTTRRMYAEGI